VQLHPLSYLESNGIRVTESPAPVESHWIGLDWADAVFHYTVKSWLKFLVNKQLTSDNMDNSVRNSASDGTSVLGGIVEWDKAVSRRLSLCSSADSPWGHLRPFMRLLEYSCHGVPWFVGVAALLLMSHQVEMQQKLLNLLSSQYDIHWGDCSSPPGLT